MCASQKVHLPVSCKFSSSSCYNLPKGAGLIRAVIYLDVLLLVNFLTTALFLLAAGLLCGVSTSGGRVVGGALAGAAASSSCWPLPCRGRCQSGISWPPGSASSCLAMGFRAGGVFCGFWHGSQPFILR